MKLVVVAPLLNLAGSYQPPFSIRAEVSTKLTAADSGQTFTGSIDVLVVKQRLWVLVIESKQSRFDVTVGIPQALSYMLSPSAVQPLRRQRSLWSGDKRTRSRVFEANIATLAHLRSIENLSSD